MKIAIVDDNTVNLTLISAMIKTIEVDACEGFTFISPVEGLAWCIENEPDLVVVDYVMPDIDGLEFVHKLRQHHPNIPILMVGASDLREIKYSTLKIGIDYMLKPLDRIEFSIRAKNLLEMGQRIKRFETLKKFLTIKNLDFWENDGEIALKKPDRIFFGFSNKIIRPTIDDAIDFLITDMKIHPQMYKDILTYKDTL